MIIADKNGLSFELNSNDFTAKIINSPNAQGSIFIPRSIKHLKQEYIITKIGIGSFKCNKKITTIRFPNNSELCTIDKCAFYNSTLTSIQIPPHVSSIGEHAFFLCFNLKEIIFSEDSELKSIDKDVFARSSVEQIFIPPSIEFLGEGWCCGTPKLTRILISKGNKHFAYADNEKKMIACKSDISSDVFDVLVFVSRDVKSVIVPSEIKEIRSFAFDECHHLKSVLFNDDSELKYINKYAFYHSTIEYLQIPKNVEELKNGWCCCVPKLNKISISPLNTRFIFDGKNLIFGKSNEKSTDFDVLVFAFRDIKSAIIPSCIQKISPFAFDECDNLKTIEFSENSELSSIGEGAFSCSSLEKISIPNHVKCIKEETFSECKHLKSIEFSDNSELVSIESKAFIGSSLESISIPSSLEELKNEWCSCTSELINVSLSPKNKHFSFIDDDKKMIAFKSDISKENFDVLAFACRNIKKAFIPSSIKQISPFSFSRCLFLRSIEFTEDSELYEINERAFSGSLLMHAFIPDNVRKIGEFAFCGCEILQKIEFTCKSKLCLVEEGAFSYSSLNGIIIPKNVNKISNASFINCWCLKAVELLGDELILCQRCFDKCQNFALLSMPNSRVIHISTLVMPSVSSNCAILVSTGTKLNLFCP